MGLLHLYVFISNFYDSLLPLTVVLHFHLVCHSACMCMCPCKYGDKT